MKLEQHCHSIKSDGNLTPISLINEAKERKITDLFLTDHDRFSKTFFLENCKQVGINSGFSTEISIFIKEVNLALHITFYSGELKKELEKVLENTVKSKSELIKKQILLLNKLGFDIKIEEFYYFLISKGRNYDTANKHDIASFLYKYHYSLICLIFRKNEVSISEIFNNFFKKGGQFFQDYSIKEHFEPDIDILNIINLNGVLSIAHPNFNFKNLEELENFIKKYIDFKIINSLEINSKANKYWVDGIIELSIKYGLFITFGSDCHIVGTNDNLHGDLGSKNPYVDKSFIESEYLKYRDIIIF